MTMEQDCTGTQACTHHNLQCGHPDCTYGRAKAWRDKAKAYGFKTFAYDQTEQYSATELAEFAATEPDPIAWCERMAEKYGLYRW